jgi:hypothetical protein
MAFNTEIDSQQKMNTLLHTEHLAEVLTVLDVNTVVTEFESR